MTVKIFTYKGNLGAFIDMDGKFLNDPMSPGQLGCIIASEEVEISPDAKKMLQNAGKEGGSFAEIMLTKHADPTHGNSSIGLMGFGKCHFGTKPMIGRTCDKAVLDHFTEVEIEAPDDYKAFVDGLVTSEK